MLSVAHFSDLNCQELWLKTGVKDRLRYRPVHEIQAFLGESLCRCLPSFHALTGCDSKSAYSGVGKKKAWKVLLTIEQMQRDLCTLGQNPAIQEPVQKAAESFICFLYTSAKNFSNVDDTRYFLFCQRNLKSEDLPPTSECLSHHIKRANVQAFVWNRALVPLTKKIPSCRASIQ